MLGLLQKNAVGTPGGKHDRIIGGTRLLLLLLLLIYCIVDDYLLEAVAGDSEHGSRMNGGAFLDGYVNKVVVLSFVVANLCAHYTHLEHDGFWYLRVWFLCMFVFGFRFYGVLFVAKVVFVCVDRVVKGCLKTAYRSVCWGNSDAVGGHAWE